MREEAIERLNDWFGDLEYWHEVLQDGENECIVLTVSDSYEKNEKNIGLYRIFKVGKSIHISEDIEYTCNITSDTSLLAGITDVMKVYKRVS